MDPSPDKERLQLRNQIGTREVTPMAEMVCTPLLILSASSAKKYLKKYKADNLELIFTKFISSWNVIPLL
ncbi:hypothetical protein Y032_0001g206 [Ancylostoma ceylanicum]|uniref:Uncharacterized protein n=1 Tax=Ancylostoma ceylanicum TaxID=53326 RepID=A0A016W435_9BILA|nr:hypothetical protein Y032_0001g206 [Ancylostoma ceylanicum]